MNKSFCSAKKKEKRKKKAPGNDKESVLQTVFMIVNRMIRWISDSAIIVVLFYRKCLLSLSVSGEIQKVSIEECICVCICAYAIRLAKQEALEKHSYAIILREVSSRHFIVLLLCDIDHGILDISRIQQFAYCESMFGRSRGLVEC